MRKTIIIISVFLLLFFVVFKCGFQIGSFKFGKQIDDISIINEYDIKDSEFAKKHLNSDSLVVVNLWATWCKPCVEEMPVFQKLINNNNKVSFVFMSIDTDKNKLQKYLATNKINDITLKNAEYRQSILNYLDGLPIDTVSATRMVPITYILKKGKVVHKEVGTIDFEEFSKILKKYK